MQRIMGKMIDSDEEFPMIDLLEMIIDVDCSQTLFEIYRRRILASGYTNDDFDI